MRNVNLLLVGSALVAAAAVTYVATRHRGDREGVAWVRTAQAPPGAPATGIDPVLPQLVPLVPQAAPAPPVPEAPAAEASPTTNPRPAKAADPSMPADKGRPSKRRKAAAPAGAEADAAKAVAREALAYVGADPLAEAVWMDAINDPARSEHERKDLIEDLNEDGFPDPHHPAPEDLPLIESRLALIEDLAPDALDAANAAAFAEAYKDLVNMYARAAAQ